MQKTYQSRAGLAKFSAKCGRYVVRRRNMLKRLGWRAWIEYTILKRWGYLSSRLCKLHPRQTTYPLVPSVKLK